MSAITRCRPRRTRRFSIGRGPHPHLGRYRFCDIADAARRDLAVLDPDPGRCGTGGRIGRRRCCWPTCRPLKRSVPAGAWPSWRTPASAFGGFPSAARSRAPAARAGKAGGGLACPRAAGSGGELASRRERAGLACTVLEGRRQHERAAPKSAGKKEGAGALGPCTAGTSFLCSTLTIN